MTTVQPVLPNIWYNRIHISIYFSFSDSLANIGSYPLFFPPNSPPYFARPPYGRNFFHHPIGRCSDGRLVIDFIAQSLGLPLVKPYIAGEGGKGVNVAVIGATALDYEFYEKMRVHNQYNTSLETQLNKFKQFLAKIPGLSLEVILPLVPPVIEYIGSTIEELIKLDAKILLVPGEQASIAGDCLSNPQALLSARLLAQKWEALLATLAAGIGSLRRRQSWAAFSVWMWISVPCSVNLS